MKKVQELIRPFLVIIFGALLLLCYLNWLAYEGSGLALGIIAVVLAAYYLTYGIIDVVLGSKLSSKVKNVFDVVSVCGYAVFVFVYFLLMTINLSDVMGPTAWVVNIVCMAGSIMLVTFYSLAKFTKEPILERLAYLFSIVLILGLLLNILFNADGSAAQLGTIQIIDVLIFVLYSTMLLRSFVKAPKNQ